MIFKGPLTEAIDVVLDVFGAGCGSIADGVVHEAAKLARQLHLDEFAHQVHRGRGEGGGRLGMRAEEGRGSGMVPRGKPFH